MFLSKASDYVLVELKSTVMHRVHIILVKSKPLVVTLQKAQVASILMCFHRKLLKSAENICGLQRAYLPVQTLKIRVQMSHR